jgi:hypothetical protein
VNPERLTFAPADAPTAIMFHSDALGGVPLKNKKKKGCVVSRSINSQLLT